MNHELQECAESGNLERMKQLVESGANVDEKDDNGMTALLQASEHDRFEVVVYLVEHGANVALTTFGDIGMTALHYACLVGRK
jgi:ankyrin repeat protein